MSQNAFKTIKIEFAKEHTFNLSNTSELQSRLFGESISEDAGMVTVYRQDYNDIMEDIGLGEYEPTSDEVQALEQIEKDLGDEDMIDYMIL